MKEIITIILLCSFCVSIVAQKSSVGLGIGVGNTLYVWDQCLAYHINYERMLSNRFAIQGSFNALSTRKQYHLPQINNAVNQIDLYEREALKFVDVGVLYYLLKGKNIFNIGIGSGISMTHTNVNYYPKIVLNEADGVNEIVQNDVGKFYWAAKSDLIMNLKVAPQLSISLLGTVRLSNIKAEQYIIPKQEIFVVYNNGYVSERGSYSSGKRVNLWSYTTALRLNYHF